MGAIRLTRSKAAFVDEGDHDRIAAHSWAAKPSDQSGERWYAYRTSGRRTIYMHREVLGAGPGTCVDHINGDGLDNRRANLRIATLSQNNANKACLIGPSMFRGVHYCKRRKIFDAVVYVKGKNKHLGQYKTAVEAAFARDRVAFEMLGEFAVLNFPCLAKEVA